MVVFGYENDVLGCFTFALISYPVDETFSNFTWRLFSIRSIFNYKIPRLYAIFQLKLSLSTKIKPLIFGAKITIFPWNFRHCLLCNETLSFERKSKKPKTSFSCTKMLWLGKCQNIQLPSQLKTMSPLFQILSPQHVTHHDRSGYLRLYIRYDIFS